MPWNAVFKNATIKKINTAYILEVVFSYYWIFDYKEVFVFGTKEEAQTKLLNMRCHGAVSIVEDITEQ